MVKACSKAYKSTIFPSLVYLYRKEEERKSNKIGVLDLERDRLLSDISVPTTTEKDVLGETRTLITVLLEWLPLLQNSVINTSILKRTHNTVSPSYIIPISTIPGAPVTLRLMEIAFYKALVRVERS